jgi:ubiquinone/menaquinone biosynthesis C-methylase UbiE
MKTKLNLGCGPRPFHPQHLDIMQNPSEWVLADKYVQEPDIYQWNAETLDEVEDEFLEVIYASHLLEHFPHIDLKKILGTWLRKLRVNGEVIINVPDIQWAAERIMRYESGGFLDGYYTEFEGEHGIQSVIYGSQSHEGEYHKACFTQTSLRELFDSVGFRNVLVERLYDAHDMGVLLARGKK